jgi:hypothetical protein
LENISKLQNTLESIGSVMDNTQDSIGKTSEMQ